MPQDAACPKCEFSFPVTEARHAYTVACPQCDSQMTVEFQKPSAPPPPGEPPYELLVRAGALPVSNAVAEKRRKHDDDDDREKGKSRGGSAMIVLLSGGLGLLVVLLGLGATGWFLFTQIDVETASNNSNNNMRNNFPNNQNKGGNNNNNNTKGIFPGTPGGGDIPPTKPKDEFDLSPLPGNVPNIFAPTLPAAVSNVTFDGKVGAIAIGGGGRYLVLHFPDQGELRLFDVANASIVATTASDTGTVFLAAGAQKVVLYSQTGQTFRVYSLPELRKLYDAKSPDGLHGIAMGSRTNGPMLSVSVFGTVALWKITDRDMTEVPNSTSRQEVHWRGPVRATPDGTAFSTFDSLNARDKSTLLTVANRTWKVQKDVGQVPFAGLDGNFYGNGVVMNRNGQDQRFGGIGAGSNQWFVPSPTNKDFFLKVSPTTIGAGAKRKSTIVVTVHRDRDGDKVATGTQTFTDLPEFDGFVERFNNQASVPFDQHLFLVPEAKVLITLPKEKDRVVIRKLAAE